MKDENIEMNFISKFTQWEVSLGNNTITTKQNTYIMIFVVNYEVNLLH